jgi:lambda family phage tail tape measure protein
MGVDIGTLELEFVARGEQLEAQMSAIRRDIEMSFKDLDKRVRQAGGGFDAIPAGAKKAGAAVNSLQGQTANMAAQFQDIAVQLQSGGSPFTIALQQGTQLGAILSGAGSVNGAVRGLGAAFMSVISPVNLVTIGLIAAGGAAVQYFASGDDTKALTDALKEQPDVIRDIRDAWGEAAQGVKEYNTSSKAVALAGASRQAKALAEGIADAASDASGRIDRFAQSGSAVSGIGRFATGLGPNAAGPAGLADLKRASDELQASIKRGAPDMASFRDTLSRLTMSDTAADSVKALARELLDATKEAGDADEALKKMAATVLQLNIKQAAVDLQKWADTLKNAPSDGFIGYLKSVVGWMERAVDSATQFRKGIEDSMARQGPAYEALDSAYRMRLAGDQGFSPAGGILALISQAEGTANGRGYNETLDYGRWTGGNRNLTMMTLDQIDALQTNMLADPANRAKYGNGRGSSALGQYMFTRETLRDLRGSLGIKGEEYFTPDMQDRLAMELVRRTGGDTDKLRGRWEGLKRVGEPVISAAMGNTAQTMPGQDQAVAQRARSYEDMIKQGEAYITEQKSEASTVGLTALAAAKLSYEQRMLAEATRLGIELTPRQREEIGALADRMAEADVEAQRLATSQQQLVDAQQFLAESASNAFIDMIVNGRSAADVISGLAKSIASAALQAVFLGQGPLAGLFGGASGGSSGAGGLFGKLFSWLIPSVKSAKGNVFQSSGLSAYSNSVVSKPTMFAFARGAGLMGEAGPEAIMPLRRDASGRLGVMAAGAGGGGSSVSFGDIHVSVPEGTSPKEAALWGNEMRRQLGLLVDEKLKDQSRSRGLLSRGPF